MLPKKKNKSQLLPCSPSCFPQVGCAAASGEVRETVFSFPPPPPKPAPARCNGNNILPRELDPLDLGKKEVSQRIKNTRVMFDFGNLHNLRVYFAAAPGAPAGVPGPSCQVPHKEMQLEEPHHPPVIASQECIVPTGRSLLRTMSSFGHQTFLYWQNPAE